VWKKNLSDEAATHAIFLKMALTTWERAHNSAQADLRADVAFHLPEGEGTVLLSADQTKLLGQALEVLGLRGDVDVRVTDIAEALLANRPRRLQIGGHTVVLPPDQNSDLVPFDCGPIAFVLGSFWTLQTLVPSNARVSPIATVPVVLGWLGGAWWANQQVLARGDEARRVVLGIAAGLAMAQGITGTLTMRRPRGPDGVQRFPFFEGLNALLMLMSFYRHSLSKKERAALWCAVLAIVAVGLVLMPESVRMADLCGAAIWAITGFLALDGLGEALADSEAHLVDSFATEEKSEAELEHQRGRQSVVDVVTAVRNEAWSALEEGRGHFDSKLVQVVENRLVEVDRRLMDLIAHSNP
jgi:hypothetical protein